MKKKLIIIFSIFFLILFSSIFLINIKKIKIQGNSWYTEQEIEALIFPTALSKNSLVCFFENILGRKRSIPFVEKYTILWENPFTVELIVYEKSIVGYVSYMSSNMYFDKDGIVVESSAKILEGIPLIKGLKFGQIVLYKVLPVEDIKLFDEILNLTQILSIYNLKVDSIKFNSDFEATLDIGEISVVLGSAQNMNGKISELKDILPNIDNLNGILYLDKYNPTDSNITYTFKKR